MLVMTGWQAQPRSSSAWNRCSAVSDRQRLGEQVPRLAVALEPPTAAGDMGIKSDARGPADSAERDHVPGIFGDDECDDEIDLIGAISAQGVNPATNVRAALPETAGADLVRTTGLDPAGLHLHTTDAAGELDDKIEWAVVAIGLADGEAESGGFGHEHHLGPFAFGFSVAEMARVKVRETKGGHFRTRHRVSPFKPRPGRGGTGRQGGGIHFSNIVPENPRKFGDRGHP